MIVLAAIVVPVVAALVVIGILSRRARHADAVLASNARVLREYKNMARSRPDQVMETRDQFR
jgi:hypothetical protein